jgi:GNAT superfamily N-acetyltransferase
VLKLRPATRADRPAVVALCVRLDPNDYLPAAWDAWLADASAEMLVAERERAIVGCLYAAVVAPGQVFSQGLRVDPGHRRFGVATALMMEQTERLRERGLIVQRGVTGLRNERARAFFATVGWRERMIVHRRRLPAWASAPCDAIPVETATLPRSLFVSRSGLAHFRRVYWEASRAELELAAREGRWHAHAGAYVLMDPPHPEFGTWVNVLGGPPAALRDLLRHLTTPAQSPRGLTIEAPADPSIHALLDELGFPPHAPEDSYVVVENRL